VALPEGTGKLRKRRILRRCLKAPKIGQILHQEVLSLDSRSQNECQLLKTKTTTVFNEKDPAQDSKNVGVRVRLRPRPTILHLQHTSIQQLIKIDALSSKAQVIMQIHTT